MTLDLEKQTPALAYARAALAAIRHAREALRPIANCGAPEVPFDDALEDAQISLEEAIGFLEEPEAFDEETP